MIRRLISVSDIKGAMAWNAVVQHPFGHPLGLFDVLDEIDRLAIGWERGMRWFSREEIDLWLKQIAGRAAAQRVLRKWNMPRISTGAEIVAVDRSGGPEPDYDFIDIDALLRNVAMAAWDAAAQFEEVEPHAR